eukprot:scaffold2258_cov84-Skeletonema_dohrnii-CCMP3373.AAC.1
MQLGYCLVISFFAEGRKAERKGRKGKGGRGRIGMISHPSSNKLEGAGTTRVTRPHKAKKRGVVTPRASTVPHDIPRGFGAVIFPGIFGEKRMQSKIKP